MIIIIGGGISGLTLALYLEEKKVPYMLLEGDDELGGCLKSRKIDHFSIELGANSLMVNAEIQAFLEKIGLESAVIPARDLSKNRFILKNQHYQKLAASPVSLFLGSFFSFSAKLAIFKEFSKKPVEVENETLAAFIGRRFNDEIVNYALSPFIAGIYAGDPEKLLVEQTFPQLSAFEKNDGSILRGMIKSKSIARRKTVSFKNGMQSLPEKVSQGLNVKKGEKVIAINKNEAGECLVQTAQNTYIASKVVLSIPAYAAADLLQNIDASVAQKIAEIHYPQMAILHYGLKKNQVGIAIEGFGGLHPKVENTFTAGSIWSSSVFENKSGDDVLLTVFVGGEMFKENANLPEADIKKNAWAEIKKIYQISGEPIFEHFKFWKKAIPQYDMKQKEAEMEAKNLAAQNIFICANWIGGVSVPDCIGKAKNLAQNLF